MGHLGGRIRLNLGCGGDRRSGYINIDAYVPDVDARMSLRHLGFRPGTVDEILCSHVLEHFGKHEVPDLLRSWRGLLKPGGSLTVIVPDFPWCVRQWLRLPESERWGWSLDAIFGLQDHPGEFHKTGFSAERLGHLLREAGFSSIRTTAPFDHGMRSIRADAAAGGTTSRPASDGGWGWFRKHLVFSFYRMAYLFDRHA